MKQPQQATADRPQHRVADATRERTLDGSKALEEKWWVTAASPASHSRATSRIVFPWQPLRANCAIARSTLR
jgi:hypothetical protein